MVVHLTKFSKFSENDYRNDYMVVLETKFLKLLTERLYGRTTIIMVVQDCKSPTTIKDRDSNCSSRDTNPGFINLDFM